MEKIYALAATPANRKLIDELEARGGSVVRLPQIETEACALDEESGNYLTDLARFDWLIFADVFAADYFAAAFEAAGADFSELDRVRVCAVGEAVADRLRFALVHADVIPQMVEAQAIAASLAAYVGAAEIAGVNFLLVCRKSALETEIEIALKEKGAIVSRLEIYGARISDNADGARLKALLAGGAIDEFVFAAPADFHALEEFAALALRLKEILNAAKISATDEAALQFLRERGLRAVLFRLK